MGNVSTQELGKAVDITMHKFLRKMVAQMYENDNDTSLLEVVLESSMPNTAPSTLIVQLKLMSINGMPTSNQPTQGTTNV